ncbi:MAG: YtxH domain-containing protein [Chloroflexi bacterium]|nr:YtxH domain-containing protein [Chloroflexota bacterium]
MAGQGDAGRTGMAFIWGALIGLAIGFLYAPKTGEQTRGLISGKTTEARDTAERIIEDARGRADRIIDQAKATAGKIGRKNEEG